MMLFAPQIRTELVPRRLTVLRLCGLLVVIVVSILSAACSLPSSHQSPSGLAFRVRVAAGAAQDLTSSSDLIESLALRQAEFRVLVVDDGTLGPGGAFRARFSSDAGSLEDTAPSSVLSASYIASNLSWSAGPPPSAEFDNLNPATRYLIVVYAELEIESSPGIFTTERYYGYTRVTTRAGEVTTTEVSLVASYDDLSAQVLGWYGISLPPRGLSAMIYVDQGSGSDENTGSVDSPLATLTAAVAQVQSGGTIRVTGGNYTEDMIVIDKAINVMGSFDPTFSVQDRLGTPTSIRTSQTSFGVGFQGAASLYVTASGNLTLSEAVVSSGLFDGLPTHALIVDGGSVAISDAEIRSGVPDGATPVIDSYGIRIFDSNGVSLQSVSFVSGSEVHPPTLLYAIRSESFSGNFSINSSTFTTPTQVNAVAQEYLPISINAAATADIEIVNNDIGFALQSATALSSSLLISGDNSGVGTRVMVTGNSIREIGNAGGSNNGLNIESGGDVTVSNNQFLWDVAPSDTNGNLVNAILIAGTTNQVVITANEVSIGTNSGNATQAVRVETPATITNNAIIIDFNNAMDTTSSALVLGNAATESSIVHNSLQARGSAIRIEGTTGSSLIIANNLLWRTGGTQSVVGGSNLDSTGLPLNAVDSNMFIGSPHVTFIPASFTDIALLNLETWAAANQVDLPANLGLTDLRPTVGTPVGYTQGGAAGYLGLVSEDFDGNPRTAPVTIGAFEYD